MVLFPTNKVILPVTSSKTFTVILVLPSTIVLALTSGTILILVTLNEVLLALISYLSSPL